MPIEKPFFLRDQTAGAQIPSSSAAISPTSAAFVLNNEPGLVWRTASLSAFIVLDFGTPKAAQAFALLWTNLRPTDTVRWRGADTEAALTTTPILDSGAQPAFSGALLNAVPAKHVFTANSEVAARFWRIDISAPSHPDAFIQVGRVLIGPGLTLADDMDLQAGQSWVDSSIIDEGPGYEDVEEYMPLPLWRCSFSWIPNATYRQWISLVRDIGQARPVLFVPVPIEPNRLQDTAVFGRLQSTEFEHPIYDGWTVQVQIKSLHP